MVMRGFPSHIDLCVSNIVKSTRFYNRVLSTLGFKRIPTEPAPCRAVSGENMPVFSIALHKARIQGKHNRYSIRLLHLAFQAQSRRAVDQFHEFLVTNDINILDAPTEYQYTSGYYAVFFTDPDGIKLELVYEPNAAN